MAEKKVTEMILKADLQCDCCYKRIRKLLSRFPEIRDWIFDEKSDSVTITVTCCDPERLRYKLCRNGRGVIKSIEIKQPEEAAPPAEPPKPEPVQNPPEPDTKAPEPVQKDPEPAPKNNEPESKPVGPVQCFGQGPMPIFCMHCYGGRMIGPWNSGFGGPSVYFEGYCYGRIGYGFRPNGPNHCNHLNPAGGGFM